MIEKRITLYRDCFGAVDFQVHIRWGELVLVRTVVVRSPDVDLRTLMRDLIADPFDLTDPTRSEGYLFRKDAAGRLYVVAEWSTEGDDWGFGPDGVEIVGGEDGEPIDPDDERVTIAVEPSDPALRLA
jgi:hypothetical protein